MEGGAGIDDEGRGCFSIPCDTELFGARVYFADLCASWQKGTVEHSNRLIRQYVKNVYSKNLECKKLAGCRNRINMGLRKKLGFRTRLVLFWKYC